MPNHVYSNMTIKGTPKEVEHFFATHFTEDDGGNSRFDFETFFPMPKELQDTTAPSNLPKDLSMALIENYGADNWYDWKLTNWGTKWNAYDNTIHDDGTVSFQTAWSLPTPIFAEMARLYPTMMFILAVVEEGGFFAGTIDIIDGKVNENLSADENQWKELATEYMGWDFEAEEQEERDDTIAMIDGSLDKIENVDGITRELALFAKENIDEFIKFSKN